MKYRVHIVIADNGWILEKCAKEIARFDASVTYGTHADPLADIQYYINYSARKRRQSPVEIAFFTHREADANAQRRYFDAMSAVEHCVFMSRRYAEEAQSVTNDRASIIAPGVALDEFVPKVRVGVIGRTYHTGRKGEGLVSQVLDVDGIEWRFTGAGWPLPSVSVADGRMPDFYNDLDYVLVPALYEGGPMAVLEGLACGVPIIASDVGWVSDYPHIPFENGNADSLRLVLTAIVEERRKLRESVLGRSWTAWGEQHLELFDRLARKRGIASHHNVKNKARERAGVSLLTHGGESSTLGGPSVRVPLTAEELVQQGYPAILANDAPTNFDEQPISHIFNVWPAESCFNAIERAKAVGKRTVLSPIFLNLSQHVQTRQTFSQIFGQKQGAATIDRQLRAVAHELLTEENVPTIEPFDGYHAKVRMCVGSADAVIYLSDYERKCLEYIGAEPRQSSIVKNPVDVNSFTGADPDLFRRMYGLDDYILCVGRIEHRKNQLMLAHAARTIGRTVVFIGHAGEPAYADLVKTVAGEFGRFVPRINPSDPLLKSAFAGAGVFCLPSWAEGAPLAALEAGAAGAPLVLSDRSSEQEYFGDRADYVHPADIDGLRGALERALTKKDEGQATALQKTLCDNNSWHDYGQKTIELYDAVLDSQPILNDGSSLKKNETIYLDLTSSFHSSGHPTGIARVEKRALESLSELYRERLCPIVWNSNTRNYLKVDLLTALIGGNIDELNRLEKNGKATRLLDQPAGAGGSLVMLGGAWIRNSEFIWSVRQMKRHLGCSLTLLVHDLIQMKLRHLYPEGVGEEFERNAELMCDAADSFISYSDKTIMDLRGFLLMNGNFYKRISKFRLGDMTSLHFEGAGINNYNSELIKTYSGKKFIIFVSSIEARKNHILLVNLWRRLVHERGANAPTLLFIGRVFWGGNEIVNLLNREPDLGRHVRFLDDVSDSDLDWFYRNCLLTVFPSLYEGWGLPVAESLSFGKVCIAARGTSIDEIAPKLTDLIDPYDFKAWLDRITFYIDNPAAVERREAQIRVGYKPASWLDAASSIEAAANATLPSAQQPPLVLPGEVLAFARGQQDDRIDHMCVGGWGNYERAGRWSIGEASHLALRYSGQANAIRVLFECRAFLKPGAEARSFTVAINDQEPHFFEVSSALSQIEIAIPSFNSKRDCFTEVSITIRPTEMLSPMSLGLGSDIRELGLFVHSVEVSEALAETVVVGVRVIPLAPQASHGPAVVPPQTSAISASNANELLDIVESLVTLPQRFTGRGNGAKLMKMVGLDRVVLRRQRKLHRREFESIKLIVQYLRIKSRIQ